MNVSAIKNVKVVGLLIVLIFFSTLTYASVTMTGTRIIYPAENSSVNLEFANKDNIPYAVQVWIDSGDEDSTPTTAKTQFIANPAMFRIMPGGGQILRLTYSGGMDLPQDRESVFYFNFLQIPPSNINKDDKKKSNEVLVILKNRVKLFYRPQSILKKRRTKEDIKISTNRLRDGIVLKIENTSPFFISFVNIQVESGSKRYNRKVNMLKPYSQAEIKFENFPSTKRFNVVLTSINDQGAYINNEYQITD